MVSSHTGEEQELVFSRQELGTEPSCLKVMLRPACHHLYHVSNPLLKWATPQNPFLPDILLHHQVAWKVHSSLAYIVRGSSEQCDKTLTLAKLRSCMLSMSTIVAHNFQKDKIDARKSCFSILLHLLQTGKRSVRQEGVTWSNKILKGNLKVGIVCIAVTCNSFLLGRDASTSLLTSVTTGWLGTVFPSSYMLVTASFQNWVLTIPRVRSLTLSLTPAISLPSARMANVAVRSLSGRRSVAM